MKRTLHESTLYTVYIERDNLINKTGNEQRTFFASQSLESLTMKYETEKSRSSWWEKLIIMNSENKPLDGSKQNKFNSLSIKLKWVKKLRLNKSKYFMTIIYQTNMKWL